MATKQKGELPCGGYLSEGLGICSVCHQIIRKGQVFYWVGKRPAAVECSQCHGRAEEKPDD